MLLRGTQVAQRYGIRAAACQCGRAVRGGAANSARDDFGVFGGREYGIGIGDRDEIARLVFAEQSGGVVGQIKIDPDIAGNRRDLVGTLAFRALERASARAA